MRPPDFTTAQWQASRTDDELVSLITLGRGMMPAFGDRIPPDGVRALVAHVRRFAPVAAAAEAAEQGASDAGADAREPAAEPVPATDPAADETALPAAGEGVVE